MRSCLWQGGAENASALPAAPKPRVATPFTVVPPTLPEAPASTPKTREQKRFGRADKDDDGRITAAELFDPRRKAFAKLDTNGNGTLSFEEWAAKTVDQIRLGRQGSLGLADPGRIRHDRAAAAEDAEVCLLSILLPLAGGG